MIMHDMIIGTNSCGITQLISADLKYYIVLVNCRKVKTSFIVLLSGDAVHSVQRLMFTLILY